MPGRGSRIDQEIAVHFRDLRAADAQAPAAGGIDQLPGAISRWIFEGRAAGLVADRLGGLAVVLDLVHPRANGVGRGERPAKARGSKDDGRIDAAVAIDEFHVGIGKRVFLAVAADAGSVEQNILGLAAIGAGIHAQRAADGAGNAEEKFKPADIGGGRGFRHTLVERGGASADDIALRAGFAEPPWCEPDHHPRHAAIAHDQIGADADDTDRKFVRQMCEEISQIVLIHWGEQHLRRAADPKPGQLGERLVCQQPPAQLRHRGFELGRDVGKRCHL